ncbi:hypothetical protein PF008_g1515 [Phytophthora fragariae]|uniref:Secreted protein n=1 Tax=Phytophthora fragariae TaxID=53985 RepID=A0A6G0SJU2_9STRA|nr:hypothetical protein PF008_g1515 [Phytophthora fragariae]
MAPIAIFCSLATFANGLLFGPRASSYGIACVSSSDSTTPKPRLDCSFPCPPALQGLPIYALCHRILL